MENVIRPAGWTPFSSDRYDGMVLLSFADGRHDPRPEILNTTFYAEFNSSGEPSLSLSRGPYLKHRHRARGEYFLSHFAGAYFDY